MLDKKKTPGKFRLVVDNRLVNADCKPVGAMSASPLSIIRMMNGAKIFTTLDLKNAFYCLLLAAPDRPYTAMSIPGGPSPQSTRMPMGAKSLNGSALSSNDRHFRRNNISLCACMC